MNQKMKKENNFKRVIFILILVLLVVLAIMIFTKKDKTDNINNMQSIALGKYTNTIGGKTYNIDNQVTEKPNQPDLTAGMIPVKYKNGNWIIIDETDEEWYDYENGIPAYIMLSDGTYQSELIADMTNKKLAEDNIGNAIKGNDVLGKIFAWIPKYAYNENNDILYLRATSCIAGEYTTPEIFTYKESGVDGQDLALRGIWIEKESTLGNVTSSMNMENNKYGIISNTKAEYIKLDENFINTIKVTGINDTNKEKIVLKVVDENLTEPIEATLSVVENDITVKIERADNGINEVITENGDTLNANEDKTEFYYTMQDVGVIRFIIIDGIGNQKIVKATKINPAIITANDYGKLVTNYSAGGVNKWQIFHKDEEGKIYLIAADYITREQIPKSRNGTSLNPGRTDCPNAAYFINILMEYTQGAEWIINNTNENAREWIDTYLNSGIPESEINGSALRSTAYMMDTKIWSEKFANNDMADYAIGGPTLELFCASYKVTHPSKYIDYTIEYTGMGYGYKVKWSTGTSYGNNLSELAKVDYDSIYIKSDKTKAVGMWIAAPAYYRASLMCAFNSGDLGDAEYKVSSLGFRPLVCLNSEVKLASNEDGETYSIHKD